MFRFGGILVSFVSFVYLKLQFMCGYNVINEINVDNVSLRYDVDP